MQHNARMNDPVLTQKLQLAPAVKALGSSGCAETDIKCICDSSSFLNSLLVAVESDCSKSDVGSK